MEVRIFQPEDWSKIEDPTEPLAPTSNDWDLYSMGSAVSMYEGNKCVGCGGIVPDTQDKHYIWLRLSSSAVLTLTQCIKVINIIRDCFDILKETYECEEVYSFVLDSFDKGKRFAKHLGFEMGGIVNINDKDYRLIRYRSDW